MSTARTAYVYVKNNTGGHADIFLSHRYGNRSPEQMSWKNVPPTDTTPTALKCDYETGIGTSWDYWWIGVNVHDGPNAGCYASGRPGGEGWWDSPNKECYLEAKDETSLHYAVSTSTFSINENSSPCSASMVAVSLCQSPFV